MEEKKNTNLAQELRDEELDKVAGGYSYGGPKLTCNQCGDGFYPENERQEINKMCPKCDGRYGFSRVKHRCKQDE